VDEGFILDAIVGRFVVGLQDVLQVITLGRDEEHACSHSFEVQGTIKVHLPVIWLLQRWRLLDLCPLRDEVSDDLGLDGLPWAKLEVKLTLLNGPLDDVCGGVMAAQNLTKRKG
jgi:hypothetical protein